MTVLAEVVDESIKSLDSGLVSKAEQEKVCIFPASYAGLVELFNRGDEWYPCSDGNGTVEICRT